MVLCLIVGCVEKTGRKRKSSEEQAAAKEWDKHNVHWVPTLNLGHSKRKSSCQVEFIAKRAERVAGRHKRAILENRRKEEMRHFTEPGLTAKEIFNSGFDEESKDLPSSGVDDPINNDIEEPGMSNKATDTNEFDFLTANTPKEKLLDESYFKGDDSKTHPFQTWTRCSQLSRGRWMWMPHLRSGIYRSRVEKKQRQQHLKSGGSVPSINLPRKSLDDSEVKEERRSLVRDLALKGKYTSFSKFIKGVETSKIHPWSYEVTDRQVNFTLADNKFWVPRFYVNIYDEISVACFYYGWRLSDIYVPEIQQYGVTKFVSSIVTCWVYWQQYT
eukprot:gene7404-13159_t